MPEEISVLGVNRLAKGHVCEKQIVRTLSCPQLLKKYINLNLYIAGYWVKEKKQAHRGKVEMSGLR